MTEIPKPPLRPVWPKLRDLYAASRQDWIAADAEAGLCKPDDGASPTAEAAVIAAEQSGVPYAEALAEAVRVIRDAGGKAGDLLGLARSHSRALVFSGPGLTREEREELRANALAACEANTARVNQRRTRPQPVLRATGELEMLREGPDP